MATGRLPDPNTAPVTAKGDLYTYSTVPAALSVGNNGETLVADSSTSTGLRYTTPVASLANPVINGGMDIWQRGTSISITGGQSFFVADRWKAYASGSNSVVSRQTTSDTTNLPNIQYAMRFQRNSGQTSTNLQYVANSFETTNSLPFAGKAVTFSFYARAGANFSSSSSLLTGNLYSGTGTDQNWIDVAYTGQVTAAGGNATLTTTWQRFVFTGTIASTATELAVVFFYAPTGTAGANDWFEVTGVQIDLGTYTASSAPTFRRSGGTLAGELAACQRYFQQVITGGKFVGIGGYYSASYLFVGVHLPVEMRTAPTATVVTGTNYYKANAAAGGDTFNSLTIENASPRQVQFYNNTEAGGTAGQALYAFGDNAAASIGLSAEL